MQSEQHPFFKKVSAEQLKLLLKASEVVRFPHEAVIFEEGTTSDALYLILKGRVSFRKRLPSGHMLTVSMSEAGDYFGEIGVLSREPRSLQAEANGETELVRIPNIALLRYLENMPGPVESLLQSIIRHLHQTTRHYIDDMLHQEKMAVVGNMMNSIIHDFKNPFCLISLSAQLLRQQHPDGQTVRLCRNIEEQVDRMVAMAADLSDFSRGEQRLTPVSLDVKTMMEEFQSLNFPFFETENITITVQVPSVKIRGEKGKLLRVFQNLISNAIDAIGEKPNGRVEITGKLLAKERMFEFLLEDNGCGIPESIRYRFFEPFVTFGKSGGTGLGTAIAKSIIDAHGGTIRFQTVTNEGTRFYIALPLAEA